MVGRAIRARGSRVEKCMVSWLGSWCKESR